ncbi:MAG: hypothetical protein GXP63_02885 [DPANN group archaeon]|nr:hypothetical protein [DPANN group archaeon]
MVTTIQLSEQVKQQLERQKTSSRETYEEVIIRLMTSFAKMEQDKERLLKEGYLEMAEETARMNREWSAAEPGWD